MGNYISQTDISNYLGSTQLGNLSGGLTGNDLAAFVAGVISIAEGRVDSYLCRRYETPVAASGTMEYLAMRAVEMELWSRNGGKDVPEGKRKNWEEAVKRLEDIASGKSDLPGEIDKSLSIEIPMDVEETRYSTFGRF